MVDRYINVNSTALNYSPKQTLRQRCLPTQLITYFHICYEENIWPSDIRRYQSSAFGLTQFLLWKAEMWDNIKRWKRGCDLSDLHRYQTLWNHNSRAESLRWLCCRHPDESLSAFYYASGLRRGLTLALQLFKITLLHTLKFAWNIWQCEAPSLLIRCPAHADYSFYSR